MSGAEIFGGILIGVACSCMAFSAYCYRISLLWPDEVARNFIIAALMIAAGSYLCLNY